jgi:Permeases of the drug/metabolite transporter (DMT) superfamily
VNAIKFSRENAKTRSKFHFDPEMGVVVLIWGANFVFVKAAIAQISPLSFAAIRFVIASLTLIPLLYWREGNLKVPKGLLWYLIGMGIVGHSLYQGVFVEGLARTSTANSAMILSTTPAFVALGGALIGIETITRRMAVGITIAMLGIVVVMMARGASLSLHTALGDLLTLVSALCWVAYVLGMRTLAGRISPLRLTTLTMIAGTPGLVIASAKDLMEINLFQLSTVVWFGLLFSAWFSILIGYSLYNRAVHRIGAVQTSIHGCVIPLVAALVAWAALGERPTVWQVIGAVLIIGGVLLTRSEDRGEEVQPAE